MLATQPTSLSFPATAWRFSSRLFPRNTQVPQPSAHFVPRLLVLRRIYLCQDRTSWQNLDQGEEGAWDKAETFRGECPCPSRPPPARTTWRGVAQRVHGVAQMVHGVARIRHGPIKLSLKTVFSCAFIHLSSLKMYLVQRAS